MDIYPVNLAAFVSFAEVWKAAGAFREETLRRRLGRVKAIRRMGNEYQVDLAILRKAEPRIFESLIRERVRKELEDGKKKAGNGRD